MVLGKEYVVFEIEYLIGQRIDSTTRYECLSTTIQILWGSSLKWDGMHSDLNTHKRELEAMGW